MICKNCKREIADDSKFCVHCGAVQDEPEAAAPAVGAAPIAGVPVATPQVEPQAQPAQAPQAAPQAAPQTTGYAPAPQPQAAPQPQPQAAPQYTAQAQPQATPPAAPQYGAPQPTPQAAPPAPGYAPPAQQPQAAAPAGFSPSPTQPGPAQQQYAAPPAGTGYAPPGYAQPVAPKKSKMPLFIGIGVAAVVLIALLFAVLGRGGGGGSDITGRYVLTRVEYQGTVLSGATMESTFPSSENYIEITSSTRGRLTLMGESTSFTYRLSGDVLTIEDGTEDIVTRVSGGKITFEYMGVKFEFTRE